MYRHEDPELERRRLEELRENAEREQRRRRRRREIVSVFRATVAEKWDQLRGRR